MWTVVFITDDIEVAKNMRISLESSSVLARVKKRISNENAPTTYEVLVPDAEVSLALGQIS